MTIKPITAAVALALASGNAAATVILPNTAGGSELVFYVSDAQDATTGYSLDLGIKMGSFNFTQSQAFNLGQGFVTNFLGSSRYDVGSTGSCGAGFNKMCAEPPTLPSGPFPGVDIVSWGVVAADTTNGSADKLLMTWSDPNGVGNMGDPFDNTAVDNQAINFGANRVLEAWQPATGEVAGGGPGGPGQTQLNERPGHANAANGSDTALAETFTQADLNGIGAIMGANLFDGSVLDIRASLDEQLPMFLFTEAAGAPTVEQQNLVGTEFGKWYIDFANNRLIYEAVGSAVPPPNAVPVPAAAWLLGSALLGMAGMRRRRA